MIKAAIVGCGKIADSHVEQIRRVEGATIVAVCDREELMAAQLRERYECGRAFVDVGEMLNTARPDVVHITTPPQTHYSLARTCLEAGCHVYVEKPFTVSAAEARILLQLATTRGLQITVGHDAQFSHAARRMRELVRSGYLGGPPVHMESYYCYSFGADAYGNALLGDREHWVRKLPGKLLQNIISHGIASLAEFIATDEPAVIAHGFTSGQLKRIGADDIVDELRVIVSDGAESTAYFTFSSQMRPALHQLRLYGRTNGIVVDDDKQTVIRLRGAALKSYAEKFLPPLDLARQYVGNSYFNVRKFLSRDFHMKSGMKFLIESFYRSIRDGSPLPISHREILLTAEIMDRIFAQLSTRDVAAQPASLVRAE
jgi:predicted dehydrogenase